MQTSGTSATAKGLKPGHLYQFEVTAINKEGISEPVFTGDPILAENPYREFVDKDLCNCFDVKIMHLYRSVILDKIMARAEINKNGMMQLFFTFPWRRAHCPFGRWRKEGSRGR